VITMKARLVRIGNSRGVRLPKAIIDQVGLDDEIDLYVEGRRVVIAAAGRPRAGWAEAARHLAAASRGLLDPPTPTRFEQDEWQW
jgi:antitoxin MazE